MSTTVIIVSFGWTADALVCGHKTVTRRQWKAAYAERLRDRQLIQAWDKSPRTGKGKPIAIIRLTGKPYLEWSHEAPAADWWAEGFEHLEKRWAADPAPGVPHMDILWRQWKTEPEQLWVVRFEVVSLYVAGGALRDICPVSRLQSRHDGSPRVVGLDG